MKKFLLLFLFTIMLFANEYHDEDLDGVPDSIDRCPHTPFSDIVDEFGCSIERLVRPRQFDYRIEYLFAKDGKFYENSYLANMTLYKGRFDLSITSLYFNNSYKKGFSDAEIRFEYLFNPNPMWDMYVGIGIELPTYNVDGNKEDYSLSFNNYYYFSNYRFLFGAYFIYTNDDYSKKSLKNSYGGYIGIERFFGSWSLELTYLYHKGKFGTVNNVAYTKIEKRFGTGFYFFMSFAKALNNQTLDSVYSLGIGRRF